MYRPLALLTGHDRKKQWKLCSNLKAMGFVVHKASTIELAHHQAEKHHYGLIILQFDTKPCDIINFCSFIRSGSVYTIIVVLMPEARIHIEQRLFDCGVNDVVIGKQRLPQVLIKRVRSHLLYNQKPSLAKTDVVMLKNTVVDFERKEVWCNGSIRRLPGKLGDLLRYFLDNPNRIISRAELSKSPIWSDSVFTPANKGGRTFDVNISKLRKIIEPDPAKPEIIKPVRGIGWKLAADIVVE